MRCSICNQWGENGYVSDGLLPQSHADIDKLISFLDQFRQLSSDFLLNIHGGEPLFYKDIGKLLDYVADRRLDTVITTNGTLLIPHADKLARINPHTVMILSIDGGQEKNDQIRGQGVFEKIIEGTAIFRERCLSMGTGVPNILVNCCVNEHNPDAVDDVARVAKEIGAQFINYGFREYVPIANGLKHDDVMRNEFGVIPSGRWRGSVCNHSFDGIDRAVNAIWRRRFWQIFCPIPPLTAVTPKGLSRKQSLRYFTDFEDPLGRGACLIPSYFIKIQSDGNLYYCPSNMDITPGNVFRDNFDEIYYGELSTKLRRYVENKLLPICPRCCGHSISYDAMNKVGQPFRMGE